MILFKKTLYDYNRKNIKIKYIRIKMFKNKIFRLIYSFILAINFL